jgi:hypothetical protein
MYASFTRYHIIYVSLSHKRMLLQIFRDYIGVAPRESRCLCAPFQICMILPTELTSCMQITWLTYSAFKYENPPSPLPSMRTTASGELMPYIQMTRLDYSSVEVWVWWNLTCLNHTKTTPKTYVMHTDDMPDAFWFQNRNIRWNLACQHYTSATSSVRVVPSSHEMSTVGYKGVYVCMYVHSSVDMHDGCWARETFCMHACMWLCAYICICINV